MLLRRRRVGRGGSGVGGHVGPHLVVQPQSESPLAGSIAGTDHVVVVVVIVIVIVVVIVVMFARVVAAVYAGHGFRGVRLQVLAGKERGLISIMRKGTHMPSGD